MSLEWFIFLALWAWALLGVLRAAGRASLRAAAVAALAALAVLVVAWNWSAKSSQRATARASLAEALPREGRSGGYVTSDQCRSCHPSQYDSWHRTYHRTMTQWAKPDAVAGNFSGVKLPWQDKVCELERVN